MLYMHVYIYMYTYLYIFISYSYSEYGAILVIVEGPFYNKSVADLNFRFGREQDKPWSRP